MLAEEADRFGCEWLLAKLSRGARLGHSLQRGPGAQTLSLYQSEDLHTDDTQPLFFDAARGTADSLSVCVSRLYGAPGLDLQHELTGVQALLLLLDPVRTFPQEYWARQRRRLSAAQAAGGAHVPLVIVHFIVGMDAEQVQAALGVAGAHVLLVDDAALEQAVAEDDVAAHAAETSLTRAIRWAAARASPQPVVRGADLRTLVEGRLEAAAEQCFSICQRLPPLAASPLPSLVAVFNGELARLSQQLVDDRWAALSWPAPEFAFMQLPEDVLPPVGWNSPSAHAAVHQLLQRLALPAYTPRPESLWSVPFSCLWCFVISLNLLSSI